MKTFVAVVAVILGVAGPVYAQQRDNLLDSDPYSYGKRAWERGTDGVSRDRWGNPPSLLETTSQAQQRRQTEYSRPGAPIDLSPGAGFGRDHRRRY